MKNKQEFTEIFNDLPTIIFCETHNDPSGINTARSMLNFFKELGYNHIYAEFPSRDCVAYAINYFERRHKKYLAGSVDLRDQVASFYQSFFEKVSSGRLEFQGIDANYGKQEWSMGVDANSYRDKVMGLNLATQPPGIAVGVGLSHAIGIQKAIIDSQIWSEEEVKRRFIFVYLYSDKYDKDMEISCMVDQIKLPDLILRYSYDNDQRERCMAEILTLIGANLHASRTNQTYNMPQEFQAIRKKEARRWLMTARRLELTARENKLDLGDILYTQTNLSQQNLIRIRESIELAAKPPLGLFSQEQTTKRMYKELGLNLKRSLKTLKPLRYDQQSRMLLRRFDCWYQQNQSRSMLGEFFVKVACSESGSGEPKDLFCIALQYLLNQQMIQETMGGSQADIALISLLFEKIVKEILAESLSSADEEDSAVSCSLVTYKQ